MFEDHILITLQEIIMDNRFRLNIKKKLNTIKYIYLYDKNG